MYGKLQYATTVQVSARQQNSARGRANENQDIHYTCHDAHTCIQTAAASRKIINALKAPHRLQCRGATRRIFTSCSIESHKTKPKTTICYCLVTFGRCCCCCISLGWYF